MCIISLAMQMVQSDNNTYTVVMVKTKRVWFCRGPIAKPHPLCIDHTLFQAIILAISKQSVTQSVFLTHC